MGYQFETRGWSMFPTILPDETVTVEPALPDWISPGTVVALVGPVTETRGGWRKLDKYAVVTHRLVRRGTEYVYSTGDLDPGSEWEADDTGAMAGRVTGIEPSIDGPEREGIRVLWYWELFVRFAFNSLVPSFLESVLPLLSELVRTAIERLQRESSSLLSVDLQRWEPDPELESLAARFVELYTDVTAALGAETGGATRSEPTTVSRPCWLRSDPVSLVPLPDPTDVSVVADVIRYARNRRRPVLPLTACGRDLYPSVSKSFGITPCTGCTPPDPECRKRTGLQFDEQRILDRFDVPGGS